MRRTLRRPIRCHLLVCIALMDASLCGCRTVKPTPVPVLLEPSNDRNWEANLALLPYAEMRGEGVKIHNIRNCSYITEQDYVVHHYDRTFDLDDLETVDFIFVPFQDAPSMAHTMLSFGLRDGRHLVVSCEVRLEEGEEYSTVLGLMRSYELMYVVADERDVIRLRTRLRKADVYVYRTKATPVQARALFVDIMQRVNKLAVEPEFYDTLTNNCSSNLVDHLNRVFPGRVPYSMELLLPGYSDRYAYDIGLLDTEHSFEETKRRAHVNELAEKYFDSPDFSRLIRR